jgi:hypothetical protein
LSVILLLENFVLSRVAALSVYFDRLVLLCRGLILFWRVRVSNQRSRTDLGLGDREIVVLAKALESNTTLTTLHLQSA